MLSELVTRRVGAGLFGLAVLLTPLAVSAQTTAADQAARQTFDIAAGSLGEVLSRFAAQAALLLSVDAALTDGRSSAGLQGAFTTEQGLQRLLAGSGLRARFVDARTVTLERVADEGAMQLAPVRVEASAPAAETALGATRGYVARRSITGTKTDTPLLETPQSVSVVTREQIEVQAADSLDEVFGYTAGIYPLGGGNPNSGVGFVARGFNITGSAPLFLNGTRFPINSLSGAEEPYFFERIELLKGPASILYGQAAPGGIINLVSKRPTETAQRELGLQVGSWNQKQLQADVAGPLSEDGELGYRVIGLWRDGDTMIEEIPDNRTAAATALSWLPTENTSLHLNASFQDNEAAYNYGKPFTGTVLPNVNGRIARDLFVGEPGVDKFDSRRSIAGYQLEHRIGDAVTLRQHLLWYDTRTDSVTIGINRNVDAETQRLTNRFLYSRLDEENGVAVDNQMQVRFATGPLSHTLLVGVDYSHSEFARVQGSGTVQPLDVFDPVYGTPVVISDAYSNSSSESDWIGIYMQDQIKIDERWIMLFGGRWDDTNEDSTFVSATGAASDDTTDQDAFTGRAALMYVSDAGIAPYLSYSESFQPQSGFSFSGRKFEPTTGEQIEAGVKWEPADADARLTVSVYELTQQNVLTPDLENETFSVQTGEIRARGVEVELQAQLAARLAAIAAYAYTDTEVTRSNTANLGNSLFSVPLHTASLWLDYALREGRFDGLTLSAGVRHVGNSYNLDATVQVPVYTIYEAALRYERAGWRFALNLKNALDKEYLAACTFACFDGDERNMSASVRYSW